MHVGGCFYLIQLCLFILIQWCGWLDSQDETQVLLILFQNLCLNLFDNRNEPVSTLRPSSALSEFWLNAETDDVYHLHDSGDVIQGHPGWQQAKRELLQKHNHSADNLGYIDQESVDFAVSRSHTYLLQGALQ